MMKNILKRWKQYKYRFVPWLAANINESSPRLVSAEVEDKIITDDAVEQQLKSLFQLLRNHTNPDKASHGENCRLILNALGFKIERQSSGLPDGGRGVFVTDGTVNPGIIVAMYPGLVYQPWEPVFWVSLANPFLFRCADGIHIDGKDNGLSKMMYNSCARRDSVCGQLMCDTSWFGETPVNPLAVGQYVNNQTPEYPANVAYQEFDVPANFPLQLRQFLPNTEARLQQDMNVDINDRLLKVVVLVSLREIAEGEELFSTYYTIVQKKNNSDPP